MFSLISACVAVSFLSGLSGQQLLNSTCARYDVSPVKNITPALFSGGWSLYAAYDEKLPWHEFDCVRFFNFVVPFSSRLDTKETAKSQETKKIKTKNSHMNFKNKGEGRYDYEEEGQPPTDTQIIKNDLLNGYYIEFTCKDKELGKSESYVGIFTRRPVPLTKTVNEINEFLDGHFIDRSLLRIVKQDLLTCGY